MSPARENTFDPDNQSAGSAGQSSPRGAAAQVKHRERARRLPELLAPAGTLDAFKAALAAGADAIYCGLSDFNARRNAENMDLSSFAHACELAHLAGSRVYVTTNILVRQDEMADALRLVHDAAAAGADAFIVADWGLLSQIRELWPEIELHLSTQANVHDVEGVRLARRLGCTRVTLSREMSLSEIEACSHEGVELEVFAHGALCICYSGECLLSSMQRGRSANRGLCRQPCRLPYELLDDEGRNVARVNGDRLLSPRDACTIAELPALVAAGAGALKIEGRMKAPDYVGTVVGAYRRALDELAAGCNPAQDPATDRALRRAFNRDFTSAYLHGRSGNELMSYERGNNRGQLAGTLASVRGRQTMLALDEPVSTGDLLEIRNPERFDDYVTVPAPCEVPGGEQLAVKLPRPMPVGCSVRVIRSEQGMAQAREFAAREWPRKRRVSVRVEARLGRPFAVEVRTLDEDGHPALGQAGVAARAEGFVVEAARTRPVSEDDLREHVGRMGTSPFEVASWDVEMDEGVGMGFSAVHAVRAQALELLAEKLLAPWRERAAKLIDAPCSLPSPTRHRRAAGRASSAANEEAPSARTSAGTQVYSKEASGAGSNDARTEGVLPGVVCALVNSPEAARAALEAGAERVYAIADDLVLGPGSSARRDAATADAPESARVPAKPGKQDRAENERLRGESSGTWDAESAPFGAWPAGIIPVLGEVSRAADEQIVGSVLHALESKDAAVAVGTVGELVRAARITGAQVEAWHTLPAHNLPAFEALRGMGATAAWLSPELSLLEIQQLAPVSPLELGIVVSGRTRVMTCEHCVLQAMGPCGKICPTCVRRMRPLTLRDEFGRTYLVTSDAHGRSRLWEPTPLDITPQIPELLRCGVTRFLVDALLLDPAQAAAAVRNAVRALQDARAGRVPAPRDGRTSSGHLFERIG